MKEQHKPTILALDDYEPNVSLIKEILEDVDGSYIVKTCTSAEEAKRIIGEGGIDAAILDFNLGATLDKTTVSNFEFNPQGSYPGFESTSVPLMHYIRVEKGDKKMPIILSSASQDLERITAAFNAKYMDKIGFDNYEKAMDYINGSLGQ